MERARQLRAEANRLIIDHRIAFVPQPELTCMTCKTPWPCTGEKKAQDLLDEARNLELLPRTSVSP